MNRMLRGLLAATVLTFGCAGGGSHSSGDPGAATAPDQERDDMLAVGEQAPDFEAKDHLGNTARLGELRGKGPIVLIFYPMDETPGCTKQLCAARDDWQKYLDRGALLFGVNPGSAKSHAEFAEGQRYPFPLLVDEKSRIAKAYGSRGLLMTTRTVYVIDRDGRIAYAKRGLPPTSEILAAIDATEKAATP